MHWLAALSLTLLPLVCGLLLCRLLARREVGAASRVLLVTVLAAPAALGLMLAPVLPEISTWDFLLSALMWVAGGLVGWAMQRSGATQAELGLLLSASLAALILLEIGARLLLPDPPAYPPPASARLWFVERARSADGPAREIERGRPWRCEALYPDHYPDQAAARTGHDTSGEVVLHVGDSMVEGVGIAQPFPKALEGLRGGRRHLNLGVSTTGPDYHRVMVEVWAERLQVRHVVQYFYTGNDLEDLDYRYHCCASEPLMDWSSAAPEWRCPEPQYEPSYAVLLGESAPPYLFRVATGVSVLARHLTRAVERISLSLARPGQSLSLSDEEYAAAMQRVDRLVGATAQALGEREICYTLVFLPALRHLKGELHGANLRAWMRRELAATAERYGVDFLDATASLQEGLRSGSAQKLYILGPDGSDTHFNPEGHARFAAWLHERLRPDERVCRR